MKDWNRFLKFVKINPNGCWDWIGCPYNKYGGFSFNGKTMLAHRFTYLFHHGVIPEGHYIHHKCKNKKCVNIEHLQAVTPKEHIMLDNTVARKNKEKTHCLRGHILEDNNLVKNRISRQCLECKKEHKRQYRIRQKEIKVR